MFRLLFKVLGLFVLAVIIFLALSLWKGGDPFRWLGQQSERAGELLKEKSEELGKEADKLKEKVGAVQDTTKKVTEGVKKTGETLKEFTGTKADK